MNFKLTTLKSVISIVIGLILGIYFSYVRYIGGPSRWELNSYSFIGFFAGLILIYLIWSLIQRK